MAKRRSSNMFSKLWKGMTMKKKSYRRKNKRSSTRRRNKRGG